MLCVLCVISVVLVASFILYPSYPDIKFMSIKPDTVEPVHMTDNEAWTNWIVEGEVTNNNIYGIGAEEIHVKLFFPDHTNFQAASFFLKNQYFGPRTKRCVEFPMKIPLYSTESGVPNLIGECFSKKYVDLIVHLEIELSAAKWLRLNILTSMQKTIQCG